MWNHTSVLAAATVALALSACSTADAACGGVKTAKATRHATAGRDPLIVGDSVLLGGVPEAARAGFDVNTRGCRGWKEGLQLLRRKRRGLPKLVVLMLGTNFSISVGDVERAMRIVGRDRLLAVMTPRGGGADAADARAVRRAGRRNPDRVAVLDWARRTRGKGSWFQPDGIHLTFSGAAGLGRYLRAIANRFEIAPRPHLRP